MGNWHRTRSKAKARPRELRLRPMTVAIRTALARMIRGR